MIIWDHNFEILPENVKQALSVRKDFRGISHATHVTLEPACSAVTPSPQGSFSRTPGVAVCEPKHSEENGLEWPCL